MSGFDSLLDGVRDDGGLYRREGEEKDGFKRRFKFGCWDCGREYSWFKEVRDELVLVVTCPFCGCEGMVDLGEFLGGDKGRSAGVTDVYKGSAGGGGDKVNSGVVKKGDGEKGWCVEDFIFPDRLVTRAVVEVDDGDG